MWYIPVYHEGPDNSESERCRNFRRHQPSTSKSQATSVTRLSGETFRQARRSHPSGRLHKNGTCRDPRRLERCRRSDIRAWWNPGKGPVPTCVTYNCIDARPNAITDIATAGHSMLRVRVLKLLLRRSP